MRTATAYAKSLLDALGFPAVAIDCAAEHPALGWARSGLMALTGEPDPHGPPTMCPVPLTSCADGALAALAALAPAGEFEGLRGSQLLAERAAIAGYTRGGRVSPGGACRLCQSADGWLAVNLARAEDWELVAAWLEAEVAADWGAVEGIVRTRPSASLVERGRVLGLAVAPSPLAPPPRGGRGIDSKSPYLVSPPPSATAPCVALPRASMPSSRGRGQGRGGGSSQRTRPRVIDLSSLWAGPLCTHLLQLAGAEVIKVESLQRPDGARSGPSAFFDLLNAGKRSVALDFASESGRAQLKALIDSADIVVEASRPRALRQLGIDAEALVASRAHLTWLSITGYGRGEPQENWIAYGDDAAVAAGLSQVMFEATGKHLICGDAIADPLTGLHAALSAWASHCSGGSRLLSLSLCEVVGQCIQFDLPQSTDALRARQLDWSARVQEVHAPRARH